MDYNFRIISLSLIKIYYWIRIIFDIDILSDKLIKIKKNN